jgi:hypothetical protein
MCARNSPGCTYDSSHIQHAYLSFASFLPPSKPGEAMFKDNDVYGHILWNSYKGIRSFSVVERDDGYVNADESSNLYLAACPM